MRMFGHCDDRALATVTAQGRNRKKPKGARAKHNDGVAFGDVGGERSVHGARGGFDHHGGFVGPVGGHGM
ncbi:unannotated protein [freshwater metagenome]|uniref:Unannotated protein n=1 Tax=freshwater metagenome TaxID=449393 RepID=A0A6J6X7R3_9ZZZZ